MTSMQARCIASGGCTWTGRAGSEPVDLTDEDFYGIDRRIVDEALTSPYGT
jgi:hypothetical protein